MTSTISSNDGDDDDSGGKAHSGDETSERIPARQRHQSSAQRRMTQQARRKGGSIQAPRSSKNPYRVTKASQKLQGHRCCRCKAERDGGVRCHRCKHMLCAKCTRAARITLPDLSLLDLGGGKDKDDDRWETEDEGTGMAEHMDITV